MTTPGTISNLVIPGTAPSIERSVSFQFQSEYGLELKFERDLHASNPHEPEQSEFFAVPIRDYFGKGALPRRFKVFQLYYTVTWKENSPRVQRLPNHDFTTESPAHDQELRINITSSSEKVSEFGHAYVGIEICTSSVQRQLFPPATFFTFDEHLEADGHRLFGGIVIGKEIRIDKMYFEAYFSTNV
ncbi:hypothetical protein G7Y89_g15766 [Cudoniella acicularis]|uniref:Uncharacterized protein n=1 Tax=Cudoniella acicularis TaxID=354080 RepID=A0A8H4QFU0_9HELO|nr:hypothetical protein G7Y89_g15766 [Cudoniella acicularis]